MSNPELHLILSHWWEVLYILESFKKLTNVIYTVHSNTIRTNLVIIYTFIRREEPIDRLTQLIDRFFNIDNRPIINALPFFCRLCTSFPFLQKYLKSAPSSCFCRFFNSWICKRYRHSVLCDNWREQLASCLWNLKYKQVII